MYETPMKKSSILVCRKNKVSGDFKWVLLCSKRTVLRRMNSKQFCKEFFQLKPSLSDAQLEISSQRYSCSVYGPRCIAVEYCRSIAGNIWVNLREIALSSNPLRRAAPRREQRLSDITCRFLSRANIRLYHFST